MSCMPNPEAQVSTTGVAVVGAVLEYSNALEF